MFLIVRSTPLENYLTLMLVRNMFFCAPCLGVLLQQMWSTSASPVVTPKTFKTQIGKFAPRFVGYNQQDAHEFLRFLLDGLHDEVNRVISNTCTSQLEKHKTCVDSPAHMAEGIHLCGTCHTRSVELLRSIWSSDFAKRDMFFLILIVQYSYQLSPLLTYHMRCAYRIHK